MIRGGVAKAERAMGRGCGAHGRHLMVPELSSGGPVSRFEFEFRVSRWRGVWVFGPPVGPVSARWWWKIPKPSLPEIKEQCV